MPRLAELFPGEEFHASFGIFWALYIQEILSPILTFEVPWTIQVTENRALIGEVLIIPVIFNMKL